MFSVRSYQHALAAIGAAVLGTLLLPPIASANELGLDPSAFRSCSFTFKLDSSSSCNDGFESNPSPWGVVPDFLSDTEIGALLKESQTTGHPNPTRTHATTMIDPVFVTDMHEAVGYGPFPIAKMDKKGIQLPLSTLTKTTRRHLDRNSKNSKTTLVFLNTNEDAYLSIGDHSVPVVAGSLVHFEGGSVDHNTIINAGNVSFLGPLNVRTLERVGGGPANDQCSSASVLPLGGTFLGDTSQSSDTSSIPECGNGAETSRKLWYKFEGTGTDIRFTTDLPGYSFDTVLAVYTGNCTSLICVDADDDGGSALSSELVANTVQGQDYFLVVRAFRRNVAGSFEVGVFLPDGVTLFPTPVPQTQGPPSPEPSMAPTMCGVVNDDCTAPGSFLRTIPEAEQGTCCDGLVCVRQGGQGTKCLYQCLGDGERPCQAGDSITAIDTMLRVGEPSFSATPNVCCPGLECSMVTTANVCIPEPTPEPTPAPTPEPTPEPTPSPTPEPTPQPTTSPTLEPTATPCDAMNTVCEFEFDLRELPDAAQGSCCGGLVCVRDGDNAPPTCQVPQTSDEFEECSLINDLLPRCRPDLVCSETETGNVCLSEPSTTPSVEPSALPSTAPSAQPSWTPSTKPSWSPSVSPSTTPSKEPTPVPTNAPIPPRECTMLTDMFGEGFGSFIQGLPMLGGFLNWVVCLFE